MSLAVNDPYHVNGKAKDWGGFFDIEVWDNVETGAGDPRAYPLGTEPSGPPKSAPVVWDQLKNSSRTDHDGTKRYSTEIEARSVMLAATAEGAQRPSPKPQRETVAATGKRAQPAPKTDWLDIDEEFPPEEDLPF